MTNKRKIQRVKRMQRVKRTQAKESFEKRSIMGDDCDMPGCVFGTDGYKCPYHDTDLYYGYQNKCLNKDADGRICPLLTKAIIIASERNLNGKV